MESLERRGGARKGRVAAERDEDERARRRERQYAAVARLGELALAAEQRRAVLDAAARLAAATLGVELSGLFELSSRPAGLRLVAGRGWRRGLVGRARVRGGGDSLGGFAVRSAAPVVVADLCAETRFRPERVLIEHGARSGIAVIVHTAESAFGVLCAHSRALRAFARDEVTFLQSIANVLGLALDRFRMEESLRHAELSSRLEAEMLDAVYRRAPVGLALHDGALRVRRANDKLVELGRVPADALLGQRFADALPGMGRELEPLLRRALRAGAPILDAEVAGHAGPDASECTWRCSFIPLGEPGHEHVLALVQDVTRERRAEQLLRESEERLRTALRGADLFVYHCDTELRYTWLAGSHPDLSPEEIPERLLGRTDAQILPPEVAGPLMEAKRRALRSGAPVSHELSLATSLGSQTWNVYLHPRRGAHDEVVGLTCVAADVSALKQKERALLGLDDRKNEFLAILAHELRNPLASIEADLQVLSGEASEREREQLCREMLDETRKLARLVDDLLDVNRLTRGKVALRVRSVALSEVVERAVVKVLPVIEERRHRLEVSIRPRTLALRADPDRLEQVLVNLLGNAAKYTQRGGSIRLRARRAPDGSARILVADTGVGLSRQALQTIFEPFAQVRSKGTARGGLGIGLTLSRGLVEQHGGTLRARSAGEGRGSTFVVQLPPASRARARPTRRSPRAAAAPPRPAAAAPRPLDVLVVDDNASVLRALCTLLERAGHRVEGAALGRDALAAAAARPPRVALVDLDLPDIGGHEVAAALRERVPGVVLVATTGFSDERTRSALREAGFRHHLVKPIDFEALRAILENLE